MKNYLNHIKYIYKIYQQKLDSEKLIFVASLLNKMQNKFPKKIYNINKQFVYKIDGIAVLTGRLHFVQLFLGLLLFRRL